MGPAAGEEQQQTPPDEVGMISYVLLQGRGVRELYAAPSHAYIPPSIAYIPCCVGKGPQT